MKDTEIYMTTNSNMKRWIIVGMIWTGALFLTYWNGEIIDRMKEVGEKEELLKLEERLLETQSDKIPEILEAFGRLHQSVAAPRMGLLSLERKFYLMAANYGLTGLRMKIEPSQSMENSASVTVFFQGFLKDTLEWLAVLRKDYPYLVVNRVEIARDTSTNKATFEISLNYRFQIV